MSFFMAFCLGNRAVYVEDEPITEVRHAHKAAPEGRGPLIFRSPPTFRTFPSENEDIPARDRKARRPGPDPLSCVRSGGRGQGGPRLPPSAASAQALCPALPGQDRGGARRPPCLGRGNSRRAAC